MTHSQFRTARQLREYLSECQGLCFVHFGSALASSALPLAEAVERCAQRHAPATRAIFIDLESAGGDFFHGLNVEWVPTVLLYRGGTELERFDQALATHDDAVDDFEELLNSCVSYYGELAPDHGVSPQQHPHRKGNP
jgi:hypothetical protein